MIAGLVLGLFIAVSVSEIFEAQTFSNFFSFPMIFLCGLFFPLDGLPLLLGPLCYILPLTYSADMLHGAFNGRIVKPFWVDLGLPLFLCSILSL